MGDVPLNPLNKISVRLNAPSYVGGDLVTGTVELECIVPFPSLGVLLKLTGYERAWWQEVITETEYDRNGEPQQVQRIVEHRQNKDFFRQNIVVSPYSGVITPGHYSFPFQYQLPNEIPGTYYEKGGNHHVGTAYHAMVLYKAKASIDVQHGRSLCSTTRLVVNEKFNQLLQPSYGEDSKTFLLVSGSLHVRIWLDKNAYIPGETILVKMKANNTSIKPTNSIKIKIIHELGLSAHGQSTTLDEIKYTSEYAGFEPCFLGTKWMPFTLPTNICPSSTFGQLVTSCYVYQLQCNIPSAMSLKVNLPLRILAPQFLWAEPSVPPPVAPNTPIPPPVYVRQPWQADEDALNCNQCRAAFGWLKGRSHCRHCGRVFCKYCVATKIPIPRLKFTENVRVCEKCLPIVRSTGGVKFQSGKQVYADWKKSLQPPHPPNQPVSHGDGLEQGFILV